MSKSSKGDPCGILEAWMKARRKRSVGKGGSREKGSDGKFGSRWGRGRKEGLVGPYPTCGSSGFDLWILWLSPLVLTARDSGSPLLSIVGGAGKRSVSLPHKKEKDEVGKGWKGDRSRP
jgi:hypothetical protein